MDEYKQIGVYILLGTLATWCRLLLAIEKITVYQFFRTSVTGAFIGVLVGVGLLEESGLPSWAKYAIFGIAVSLAEDIFVGILNVGKEFRANPKAFVRAFWRK